MRKIVSFFLIAVFLITPVSAASSSSSDVEYIQKASFWTWAAGQNEFLHGLVGSTGASCPSAEDGYHHASSYRRPEASWGGLTGYYKCICDLCGAEFKAYESDLQQSYDAQVAELPATLYGADGSIYVIPSFAVYHLDASSSTWTMQNGQTKENNSYRVSVSLPLIRLEFLTNSYHSRASCRYGVFMEYTMPFLGTAELLYSSVGYAIIGENGVMSLSDSFGANYLGGIKNYAQGSIIRILFASDPFEFIRDGNYILLGNYINFYLNNLRLKLTPFGTGITAGNIYSITSRPTSITGDYGIIGDNGQIIKVEGDKIVNETNNTIYNPATGETHTMSDWSYNYEDRSYTVTTETGDTITITYGDENVTIVEGDTIYNIYYLVDGSGSENPGPDVPPTCDHTWTETSRTDPTCSTPGKVTFTCSKCSQTKTETLPALGHNWTVERTVQTSYDEQGNLVQQGYTIYSCTVCGEQYKDMEGTGPPGAEGDKSLWEQLGDLIGSGLGGILQLIEAVVGKFLDALTALVTMITDKLSTVVEAVLSIFEEVPAMFGGFLAFLTAMFPFLPPEIITLLTFGIAAVVFIGIIKALRR